jgi:glycosyltransferase involved in cell wall biosynthesis
LKNLLATLTGQAFVLAVSSDNPNKNFASVVSALALMGADAPPCVIVGPRNDRVFAQSHLDASRVHHLGYVSDAELVALYQHAGVLVYPSFYEGFGLPPLEAMWHGCPVIAARTSALPEVCGDAAVYCDASDPRTLAESIRSILGDAQAQQSMRLKGRAHARQFQWRLTVDHVLECLDKGLKD